MRAIIFIILILLTSCAAEEGPLSTSLASAIDNFIKKHPKCSVIQIQASKLDGHDLLFITSLNSYDPKMIDGYCIYKDKLITYYQTDSMDRESIIDAKYLLKFNGKIKNYESTHSNNVIFEPKQELYEIVGSGKLSLISNQSELKFNRDNITGRNVIKNENVNKLLNSYIQNNVNVLYELRFVIKNNKRYATLRSMIFYDKDKYDGYFYRNGYLVVLYDAGQSNGILDGTWIKKGKFGIPNFRHTTITDWNYPYPIKFEILSNGHIRQLPLCEGLFI